MNHRLISGFLTLLTALPLGSLAFIGSDKDKYYTLPWQIAAIVFVSASFLFGQISFGRQRADEFVSSTEIRRRFFWSVTWAWILGVAVLFALSFTPLVLGQDNGDGSNGIDLCIFFAIASSLVYSGISVPYIFVSSILFAPLMKRN